MDGRLDGGLHGTASLLAQLLGELHDEDGVLASQPHQHDESHLAEDVVGQPAHHLQPQGAQHRQGHREDDHQGQGEALSTTSELAPT